MAFKKEHFGAMHNNAAAGAPRIWVYYNDGADTVTAAGFFGTNLGILNNDLLLVCAKNAGAKPAWYKLTVNASTGVVTAAALS